MIASRLACFGLVLMALLAPHDARAQAAEGIKVHGDWTIDIREPDGTLVARHEFKNHLVLNLGGNVDPTPLTNNRTGASGLVGLLLGQNAAVQWEILAGAGEAAPHPSPCATSAAVLMNEAGGLINQAQNMCRAAVEGRMDPGPALVLLASWTAAQTGWIGQVITRNAACRLTAAGQCSLATPHDIIYLTGTRITPIEVQQGRLVQVRVAISFS